MLGKKVLSEDGLNAMACGCLKGGRPPLVLSGRQRCRLCWDEADIPSLSLHRRDLPPIDTIALSEIGGGTNWCRSNYNKPTVRTIGPKVLLHETVVSHEHDGGVASALHRII